jgi:hypothetical protein
MATIQAQEQLTLESLWKRYKGYEKQMGRRDELYLTFAKSLISNFKAMNKQVEAMQKLNRGLGESFAKAKNQVGNQDMEASFDINTELLIDAVAPKASFKASLKKAFLILGIKNIKDVFKEPIDTYSPKSPTSISGFSVKAQERFVKFLATNLSQTFTGDDLKALADSPLMKSLRLLANDKKTDKSLRHATKKLLLAFSFHTRSAQIPEEVENKIKDKGIKPDH